MPEVGIKNAPGRRGRTWFLLSLCLIALLILSTSLNLYYYSAYTSSEQRYARLFSEMRDITHTVNLLIEFSNGTRIWYNDTLVPIGWTLFNLTLKTTGGRIEYQAAYGSVFITSINGIKGSGAFFWLWYSWDSTSKDWVSGMSGSDQYVLREGDILAWYLVDTSNYPNIPKP